MPDKEVKQQNQDQPDDWERLYAMLEKHAAAIMEHFDTVQIFATRHDGQSNTTDRFSVGEGNFYSRYGQVKLWARLTEDEEKETEEED